MKKKIALIVIILLIVVSFFLILVYLELFGPPFIRPETPQIKQYCINSGRANCEATGELPVTWVIKGITVEGTNTSCQELLGCSSCSECGFEIA